jgi:hypothetical protein
MIYISDSVYGYVVNLIYRVITNGVNNYINLLIRK